MSNFRKPQPHAESIDLMDQDYLPRLSPQDRAWVERFNREYYLAAASSSANVHDGEGLRKCWRDVKARQRAECAFALARTTQYATSTVEQTDGPRVDDVADGPSRFRRERGNTLSTTEEDKMAQRLDCRAARDRATKARGDD